ncbi:MAG: metallophosphoesterase [Candidatus Caldarchaeales archaeon]
MTRILFTTDVHGSEYVFRKFLNALSIYKIDVGIMMGDLSGKLIIPIIKNEDGSYSVTFLGEKKKVKETQIEELKKEIMAVGYYPVTMDRRKFEELEESPEERDRLFINEIKERLRKWIQLAEERLKDKEIRFFISAGNDDPWDIEDILNSSKVIINVCMRKVYIDDFHEMITVPYTNPTPWRTPREISEEELAQIIDRLAGEIDDIERAVFNLHAPPFGTPLDLAPKLSKDMRPSVSEMVHVGSIAVLEAIKKYQPILGLHGHIHESKGSQKIGRTTCINPGSEYGEGIMRGVIIELEKDNLKSFMFVSG